jgi:UV excision repair protein RAD23
LSSDRQKLIHAGKVLKDNQTVAEVGVTETDFIVCMVTKETTAPKPKVEAEATPAPTSAPAAAAPAPAAAAPVPAPVAAPMSPPQIQISAESIAALTGMGFPEAEVRAALQAAMGNPDLAYEFLLTGIPEQRAMPRFPAAAAPASPAAPALVGVQQLRNHPQFNMLKQLIQTNPASLPQVLNLIGQQNPALLQTIHANEQEFLALMNEPITNTPAPAPAAPVPAPLAGAPGGMPGMPGMPAGGPNPAEIFALLGAMPAAQRAQFAQSMGLSADQLNMAMQMMSSLPPEQLQQVMSGIGRGAGGPPPGTITLTHEEMESVNRLMALGFSQQQAAQAFIACDRNENLAANFLFENGWGDDAGDFGDAGHEHEGDDGHDDDMYN